MKRAARLIALFLCLTVFLSGCSFAGANLESLVSALSKFANEAENMFGTMEDVLASLGDSFETLPEGPGGESNEEGNVVEVLDAHTEKLSLYDAKGRLVFYHIITYDDNHREIHRTAYTGGGVNKDGDYEYTYTDDGKLLEYAWFVWSEGYLMKASMVYDENGFVKEDVHDGSEEHRFVGNKTIYFRNETGRIEREIYYSVWYSEDSHGEPVYNSYTYNDLGQLVYLESLYENGAMNYYDTYAYNELGQRTQFICYKPDGTVDFRYEYKYNENGKRISEERYDGKGNLVSVDNF